MQGDSSASEINYDVSIKLVIVGESGVGKSNLILRLTSDKFDENLITTIAMDFYSEEITVRDKRVKVLIWDTAGQEKYWSLAKAYYWVANGIILVYDITDRNSFVKAKQWIDEIRMATMSNVKILFIGNKIDLVEHRQVTTEEALAFAKENNLFYFETSSKTNQDHCVQKAFYKLFEETVDVCLSLQQQEDEELQNLAWKQTHRLVQSQLVVQKEKKGGCCQFNVILNSSQQFMLSESDTAQEQVWTLDQKTRQRFESKANIKIQADQIGQQMVYFKYFLFGALLPIIPIYFAKYQGNKIQQQNIKCGLIFNLLIIVLIVLELFVFKIKEYEEI